MTASLQLWSAFLEKAEVQLAACRKTQRTTGITLRPSINLSRMNSTLAMMTSRNEVVASLKAQEQLDTTRAKETPDLHNFELMELTHLKTRSRPAPRNLARPRRRRRSPRPLTRLPKATSQWLQVPCSGHCGPGRSTQGPLYARRRFPFPDA